MRLSLLAACGLLVASFAALVASFASHSDPSVEHVVTVPGVAQLQSGGEIGLSAPSGTSPFAVYVAPAAVPAATPTPAAPPAPAAQAPAPAPPQERTSSGGPHKHH